MATASTPMTAPKSASSQRADSVRSSSSSVKAVAEVMMQPGEGGGAGRLVWEEEAGVS